jgi:hypothetical protein
VVYSTCSNPSSLAYPSLWAPRIGILTAVQPRNQGDYARWLIKVSVAAGPIRLILVRFICVNSYLGKLVHSDLVSLPNNPHFHRRNINFHNYTLLIILIIEQTSTFHLRRPYTFTLRITGRQGMSVDVVCIVITQNS